MEQKKTLGIYYSGMSATAVVANSDGGNLRIEYLEKFELNTQNQPNEGAASAAQGTEAQPETEGLAFQIAQAVRDKKLSFESTCIAIDSSLYTQHNLHSELSERKQIAQTIKFDAEEAIATDVNTLAISFNLRTITDHGSDVCVFSMQRSVAQQLLSEFQAVGLDPVVIEPDIICMARLIRESGKKEPAALYSLFSDKACYMLYDMDSKLSPGGRTFLTGSGNDKTAVLSRQVPLTVAALGEGKKVDRIIIGGGDVDTSVISERTGLSAETMDLSAQFKTAPGVFSGDPAAAAIAAGAALSDMNFENLTDFREDFAPYQGRKKLLEKICVVISAALTLMLLAAAMYFQVQVFKNQRYESKLEKKLEQQYSAVMFGKTYRGPEPVFRKLERESSRIERVKQGLLPGDDESISARLTFVLEVLNKLPEGVDLNIDEISLSEKAMRLRGDTNNRASTLALFKMIDSHEKLRRTNENLKQSGARDSFILNLELRR